MVRHSSASSIERHLVHGTDHEHARRVPVGQAAIQRETVRVRARAGVAAVQVDVLRPGERGHQCQAGREAALQFRLEGVINGVARLLAQSNSGKVRERPPKLDSTRARQRSVKLARLLQPVPFGAHIAHVNHERS